MNIHKVALAMKAAATKLGYKELRPQQELTVQSFVSCNDVFISLPTGSGKSLCFWILPGVFDELRNTLGSSIVIVVSPLVALMKDQVKALCERGARAVYIGDAEGLEEICSGEKQLIYMSPESLLTDLDWRDIIQGPVFQANLVAIIIDEAHCVTKW